MDLFWYFFCYSFCGFLLEVLYAKVTHSPKPDRKCFLLLPLCPVYGLGALGILAAATWIGPRFWLNALVGIFLPTAVEYCTGVFYQRVLGVSFWDYSHLPLNLGGRVCLLFSLIWSILSLVLIYLVHPWVTHLVTTLPTTITIPVFIFTCADGLVSLYLLKTTGTTDSLKWYAN